MHKILIFAAAALAIGLPAAAQAQQASILVVDSERLMSDCTACKAASAQLQSKQSALRTRAQTLQTQLAAERKPIQDAVDAGKADATLRIAAWLATAPRWITPLERDEPLSLFTIESASINPAARGLP